MRNKSLAKVLSTALATVFAAGALAGCGSTNALSTTSSAADKTSQAEEKTETTAENTQEVIKITAATKGSPAPYMTIDENNEVQGSDIDIIIVSKIHDISYTVVNTEEDALLLENALIKKYNPRYNVY